MSDNTPQQGAASSDTPPSNEQQAPLSKETESKPVSDPSNPDASTQTEPEMQPVQLKSHFRGLPKNWEINKKKAENAEKET